MVGNNIQVGDVFVAIGDSLTGGQGEYPGQRGHARHRSLQRQPPSEDVAATNTSHNMGDAGFNLTTYPYAWTALADPTCTQAESTSARGGCR